MSLAVTPAGTSPSTVTDIHFGRDWGSVCVASTCSTSLVPMPNASAPKAPWVAVWLSPHTIVMPGSVRPCSGPITCTMPWFGIAHREVGDAELGGVAAQRVDLLGGDLVGDRQVDVGGGDVVVLGGHGEVGAAHAATAQPQPVERLRAGDLVHEVQVDVEQIGLALGAGARGGGSRSSRAASSGRSDRVATCVPLSEIDFLRYGHRNGCRRARQGGCRAARRRRRAALAGRSAAGHRICRGRPPTAWPSRSSEHGLLRRDDDGRFDLGPELASLGRAAAERFPLAALALPVLERLRDDERRERAAVRARGRTSGAACCRCSRPHALRWIVPEGVLFPLDVGSAGTRADRSASAAHGWVDERRGARGGRGIGQRAGDDGDGHDRGRGQHLRADRPHDARAGRAARRRGRRRCRATWRVRWDRAD